MDGASCLGKSAEGSKVSGSVCFCRLFSSFRLFFCSLVSRDCLGWRVMGIVVAFSWSSIGSGEPLFDLGVLPEVSSEICVIKVSEAVFGGGLKEFDFVGGSSELVAFSCFLFFGFTVDPSFSRSSLFTTSCFLFLDNLGVSRASILDLECES